MPNAAAIFELMCCSDKRILFYNAFKSLCHCTAGEQRLKTLKHVIRFYRCITFSKAHTPLNIQSKDALVIEPKVDHTSPRWLYSAIA